jgi:transcriptional regulator with GAF, ATPase, and Fis domain
LVVLISLWAGFLSTAFACAVAALCFDYFFTQPLYHLWMSEPVEIAATIAFSGTALVISRLLSRVRERTAEVQQTNEQLQAEIAERRRAEEKIRQSEAELQQLIDAIPQQVFVFDANWDPLFANRRELEYTGLAMVAVSDSTVLLLGETGTGKELIARAVHNRSLRKQRPFVKLNCAAVPSGLLESELFGPERGAFTGAIAQRAGRLVVADRGTLFLDEVEDIPLEIQPKLLRVLQEREFERLGSTWTKKVDVRVVAANHRALEEMIVEKQFRLDLYYRLNVFPISIPPLRERPEDIPLLVRHFVQQFAQRMNKTIEAISSDRDRGSGYPLAPPTPPCVRVRTRRFGGLS